MLDANSLAQDSTVVSVVRPRAMSTRACVTNYGRN